jgi:hypothetical protein
MGSWPAAGKTDPDHLRLKQVHAANGPEQAKRVEGRIEGGFFPLLVRFSERSALIPAFSPVMNAFQSSQPQDFGLSQV